VNYGGGGSGTGRQDLADMVVDFAGADSAFKEPDLAKNKGGAVLYFPVLLGPITISYNLDGVPKLQLSADTIAKIFQRTIKKWSDKAIAADNPGAKLPDQDIVVAHRADGSGTTENFTKYLADAAKAFESVEYIMRDVQWGWLIRYLHSSGASLFFIVVYLHMFRGLIYGSYRKPRELVWLFGCGIFLCLMAEAFMGYLLPWGQMSYWGAQVIVNLFSAVPFIGPDLSLLIRGDFVVGDATQTLDLVAGRYVSVAMTGLSLSIGGQLFSADVSSDADEIGRAMTQIFELFDTLLAWIIKLLTGRGE